MRTSTGFVITVLVLGVVPGLLGVAAEVRPESPSILTVKGDRPARRMAGGIGASWHAIRVEYKHDEKTPYKYDVRHSCPQGSAVGANPPLDSAAWGDIERCARWLGLDWLRVEMDRRMYEPHKGQFDWNGEEMRTLYRILDWCQRHDADVFLTEMWRDVPWLAYPEVHPLLSAPNSLADFAEGLAALADHLIRQRRYTCVKWLCIANEPPGGTWGYWWSRGADNALLSPAFKAVREALDRRGISLPLSGPDWTDLPKLDPAQLDFAPYMGAFDIHSYGPPNPDVSHILGDWAQWAHEQGKPFFLTELGDMSLGWGADNPGPRSYEAVLSVAEKVLRGLNAGVDGFNRWSFLNRGDQDGQWQLVRTWDMTTKRYLAHAEPEPVPYYGYAMLTRFMAKYSRVLPCEWQLGPKDAEAPRVFAAALRSPEGRLTLLLVNREAAARETRFRWEGLDRETVFYRYTLTEDELKEPDFQLAPEARFTVSSSRAEFSYAMAPRSVSVFTAYDLAPDAPGVSGEQGEDELTVELDERFGVAHPQQIVEVSLPHPLAPGAWFLRDAGGGVKPVQVFAGRQRIALQTDLPAGSTRSWRLAPKDTTAALSDAVSVRTNAGALELSNGLIGIRLPAPGSPASTTAAPLLGLRWRDGSWLGAGTNRIVFAGGHPDLRIRGLEVRIVEPGPLVAIAEVIYTLDRPELRYGQTVLAPKGPGRYLARFRLEAGQPSVIVTEETDTQFAWTLDLPGLKADQGRYRGHHASEARWGVEPDGRCYRPAHERAQMDATMDLPFDRDYLPGGQMSSPDGLFRRLPAWDPWIYDGGWYWQFYTRDGDPNAPLLGLFAGRASLARDVGEAGAGLVIRAGTHSVGIGSSAQHRSASGQLQSQPRFEWGIFAGTKRDLAPPERVQPIARQMNLHAGFNLSKLAAIRGNFPDPPQGYGSPFMSSAAVTHLKAALQADKGGLDGKGLAGTLARKDAYSRDLIAFWSDSSPEQRAQVVARAGQLAQELMDALVHGDGIYNFRFHYWMGGLEMSRMLLWIDQALGCGRLTPAEREKLKAIVALFGTLLWDNDFVPLDNHQGINLGTPNMPVQQAGYRDQFALFLSGEPSFGARAQAATARVVETLCHDILDNGAHLACVHYIGAGMGPTLTLMQQLQQAGIVDFFKREPRTAAFAEFLMQCATPPEPRFGGARKQIAIGDGPCESSELFGQLGTAFAPTRPALSARLMGMWRAQGERHSSFHGTTLLKIDPGQPAADPALGSASFPGQFTVLRHGWNTPHESAVWLLTGNHYVDHSHADEGEVVIYLLGAPISLDWGSQYEPRSDGAVMHSIALPERLLGWPWGKDSPPVNSGGELWGNYPGTRTTVEEFHGGTHGWVRSRMLAPDRSFTWTRAVSSAPLGDAASVVLIQDSYDGAGAGGAKVFTLNLCAEGEVETPAGKVLPTPRLRGYGSHQGGRRENPSSDAVFPLAPGVHRLRFTGQHWPRHPTGGVDFDIFIVTDRPQEAFLGNWAHAWHPGAETQEFQEANGRPFEERQYILRLRGEGGFRVLLIAWSKGTTPPRMTIEQPGNDLSIRANEAVLQISPSGQVSPR